MVSATLAVTTTVAVTVSGSSFYSYAAAVTETASANLPTILRNIPDLVSAAVLPPQFA